MTDAPDAIRYDLHTVASIYYGSDGSATTALYEHLQRALGPTGILAVNLFRACKASERAKVYRGRGYKTAAYDRKQWAMDNLCRALVINNMLGLRWGWGLDRALAESGDPHHHILYVDLPTGQVSFHTGRRGDGPDYSEEWDGIRGKGADRILRWIGRLLGENARGAR